MANMSLRAFPRLPHAGSNPRVPLPRAGKLAGRTKEIILRPGTSSWIVPLDAKGPVSVMGVGGRAFAYEVYGSTKYYTNSSHTDTSLYGPDYQGTFLMTAEEYSRYGIPSDYCFPSSEEGYYGVYPYGFNYYGYEQCYYYNDISNTKELATFRTNIGNTGATSVTLAFPANALTRFQLSLVPGSQVAVYIPDDGFIRITYDV
jgi:hypothetical protein